MNDALYIWIVGWGRFQHYKPTRERGPAWIKDYTAQMSDERYLELTDRQRALLRDLRDIFATFRGRLPDDSRMITRQRCSQTRRSDLAALNQAGFILFLSRPTLDLALEQFYSREEVEVEKKEPSFLPAVAREPGRTEGEDIDFDTINYDHILKEIPL